MPITVIPTPPLRSQGKTQDQYSTEMEATLVALPLMASDFNAAASAFQLAVTGTSTTSVTIGTGSKSFTTQTGLGFVVGMTLRIANSSTNYMTGDVTSYNTGTGALVVNVTSVVGSGTFASWTISLAAVGANTAGAVSFTPAGNIAATNVQTAIQELDTEKLSSAAGAVTGTNLEDITTAETVGSSYVIPVITKDVNGRVTTITTAQKIISGTAINTTSGTSHDFTSIPSGVKRITLMLNGVSTNGTSNLIVQIGSGSIQTTGYSGAADNQSAGGGTATSFTAGLGLERTVSAIHVRQGIVTFVNISGNVWIGTYIGSTTGSLTVAFASTTVSLSGTLDRIRLTSSNGTDTFDAGSINILLE